MNLLFKGYYFSPIGWLQIVCDNESLLSLQFTDNEPADLPENNVVVEFVMQQLDAYFNGNLKKFDVRLHPSGTEFQLKVWNQLQKIEFGKTISYLQLAKKLGDPKVIRAAGTANGKNPVAIIIPCHRVIGTDGTLVGYAGKIWRKKWLLEHENAIKFRQQELQFE